MPRGKSDAVSETRVRWLCACARYTDDPGMVVCWRCEQPVIEVPEPTEPNGENVAHAEQDGYNRQQFDAHPKRPAPDRDDLGAYSQWLMDNQVVTDDAFKHLLGDYDDLRDAARALIEAIEAGSCEVPAQQFLDLKSRAKARGR